MKKQKTERDEEIEILHKKLALALSGLNVAITMIRDIGDVLGIKKLTTLSFLQALYDEVSQ